MPGLRFSQSTDLAIHGLWALACLETGRFILLSDIASRQHVSESYLSKVFQKLTRAGLTRAMRGKRGGYTLARPPAEISVGDVVRAMAPEPPMYQCLAQERCCEAIENCLLLRVFAEAEQHMYAVLDRVTLADLLSDLLRSEKRMGWIQLDMTSAELPQPPCGTAVLSLTSACLDVCACLRVCPRHGLAYSLDCYSRYSYWYALQRSAAG